MTFTPHPDYANAVVERHPQPGIEVVYESRDLVTGRLYHWCAVPARGADERRGYTAPTREEAIRLALKARP